MQKKTRPIIVISIIIMLAILLILLLQNNGILTKQQNQQLADVGYTTQIGDITYNITDKIENDIVPTISAGMIPIKQDGEYWTIVDTTDNTWFNYGDGVPAYMMLNDGKYQSEEYYQMPATKEVAKAGTQINKNSTDLGSIYMWIPRYAYNENGDIIYIKQTSSVAGTWTMPNVFLYETEVVDYALAGIWVECDETTEIASKIEEMNTKDSQYGFIANTKTNAMTEEEQEATQILVENLSANGVGGCAFDDMFLENVTNINHTIIRIFNTNILESIKAKVYLDDEADEAIVEIINNINPIEIVINEDKIELTEINTNTYKQSASKVTYEYIVVDNKENMKLIKLKDIYLIRNVQELVEFRDKVNAGNSFLGIEVFQTKDIDMSSVCGKNVDTDEDGIGDTEVSWTPIGATGKYFAGTYNGGYHTISNLYMNTNKYSNLGMFSMTQRTTEIKNLVMNNLYVRNTYGINYTNAGGIVGNLNGGRIEKCGIESGEIIAKAAKATITNAECRAGGIAGMSTYAVPVIIDKCYNKAKITATFDNTSSSEAKAGGMIGCSYGYFTITNCYNRGVITANGVKQIAGGLLGDKHSNPNGAFANCYNTGDIPYRNYGGGIIGRDLSPYASMVKCYTTAYATMSASNVTSATLKTYASTLGNAYKDDEYNLNNGYPILEWEIENIPIYAKAYVDDDEKNVIIEILYSKYGINKVINNDEEETLKLEDGKYSEPIKRENNEYTIIDNKNNIKNVYVKLVLINTAEKLVKFRDSVNSGNNYKGITVIQTSDIDLSSVCGETIGSWKPIGATGTFFSGTYNGDFHTIKNLYISTGLYQSEGLFSQITSTATIKKLELDNLYIKNTFENGVRIGYTGGISAVNDGTIEQCGIEKGNIIDVRTVTNAERTAFVGGISGFIGSGGVINECYNKAEIYSQAATDANSGGIVGYMCNNAIVTNSYNLGKISSSGNDSYVGGIAASAYQQTGMIIKNCYNAGALSGSGKRVTYVRRNIWMEI